MLSLAALPMLGWGVNVPRVANTNAVVWVFDDDRSVSNLSIFDGADYPGAGGADYVTGTAWQPASTPNLDTLSAAGVRVPFFNTQPQCNITYASLYSGRYPVAIGSASVGGEVSSDEPSVCNMLHAAHPNAYCAHIGKRGTASQETGLCSEDGTTLCRVDSECSGTCDVAEPFMFWGFDEHRGETSFNGAVVGWGKETITWAGEGSAMSTNSNGTIATYKDQDALDDFEEMWPAHAGVRRFFAITLGDPHSPLHEVPAGTTCVSGNESCFDDMVEHATETVLQGIIDAIGEDIATTCVIYASDNGSDSDITQDLEGSKFGYKQGALQPGLLWIGSCVNPAIAGQMLTLNMDLPDLHRATLEMLGAWNPPATLADVENTSRLNGQALVMHGDPNLSAVSGYCRTGDCYPNTPNAGSYAVRRVTGPSTNGNAQRVVSDDSGYKLVADYVAAGYGVEPWQLYLLPDETTDLYDGSLTSGEQTALDALIAKLDVFESDYQSDLVTLSMTAPGSASTGVAASFRLRITSATDIDLMPRRTTVVCDIDFGEGSPVRFQRNFEPAFTYATEVIDDSTVYFDYPFTYSTPGSKTVSGSCWDIFDRTDSLITVSASVPVS